MIAAIACAALALFIGYLLGLRASEKDHKAQVDALCRALEEKS